MTAPPPRILVLSQVVPETAYAGSLVIHRLLDGYTPDRLLVIGPRPQQASLTLPCRYLELTQPAVRTFRTRFAKLARSFSAFGLFPGPRLSRGLRAEVRRFAPDVVVTIMQVQPYYRLAWRTARALSRPLVLIVHDAPDDFEPVAAWAAGGRRRVDAAVYRGAVRRLCISPEMADHLRAEFGCEGEVLYPSRSDDLTARPVEEADRVRTPGALTIGYAGGLAYGYGDALAALFPVLAGANARLRLHTKERPRWADPAVVDWAGFAQTPADTWAAIKRDCDAVILAYSRDAGMRRLYETHFPSKLPEYLALGMPVLILGPEYATGVRWGLRNPTAAETVTADDPAAWQAALDRLRRDPARRRQLADGAVAAGGRDFDPHAIRAAFLQHLAAVARGSG